VTIKIRRAREKDLDIVHNIEKNIYENPWSKSFFRLMSKIADELFIIAEKESEIIGYSVGEVESRKRGKVGHLMNIAVKKAYRNQGIGTRLMDVMEARFEEKGANSSYLEVRVSNHNAQKLYRKRGYLYVRRVKNYYGDEDAFVMTKKL